MRIADPHTFEIHGNTDVVLSATAQKQGHRAVQEDYVARFSDECFVVADGVGGLPHGDVAAKLAAETAVWAYKHVRTRRFYWADKKLFLRRIFRTTNLAVWQKRREKGFENGLATTLVVAIAGPRSLWVGSVGDSAAYLCRAGVFAKLTDDDIDGYGYLTKAIGIARSGLIPQVVTERFIAGDVLLLTSDGITTFVNDKTLQLVVETMGDTQESLDRALSQLLDTAAAAGSRDNMSAVVVKRIARERSAP